MLKTFLIMILFAIAVGAEQRGGNKSTSAPATNNEVASIETADDLESVKRGLKLFSDNACTTCHGDKGLGNGPAARGLQFPPRNFVSDKFLYGNKPQEIFKTLSEGVPQRGMPSFANLKTENKWDLVHFILSLRKK
ncbi:MAG: c-type cytochrome [Pseudobdellovibrio sp.]